MYRVAQPLLFWRLEPLQVFGLQCTELVKVEEEDNQNLLLHFGVFFFWSILYHERSVIQQSSSRGCVAECCSRLTDKAGGLPLIISKAKIITSNVQSP